jgi:hypothetical protein
LITWCHVEWYVYDWLFSIKCFRGSCGLRKVWYDTNECLAATLDRQLFVTRVTRRVLLMEQELLAHPKHPRWPPVFSGVGVARSLVFNVLFYRSLIVLLVFFCLPLYYLLFFDLRVLTIPLVSSNLSYVLSLMTRSCIPSFCYIILNAPPLFSSATIYLYILLCVCLFSSWLCTIKHQSMHINSFKGFIDQQISADDISV